MRGGIGRARQAGVADHCEARTARLPRQKPSGSLARQRSVCELARVITPENRAEVLPRFFHASKQEAKAVAAEIAPREVVPRRMVVTALEPTAPSSLKRRNLEAPTLPDPPARPALDLGQSFHPGETAPTRPPESSAAVQPPAPAAPTQVVPLTADARRLHVTVSKRFLKKLEAARDALSHSHPGADAEAILEAGLDLLLERAAKRRGIVERPRPAKTTALADQRLIPAAVSREVWLRDDGKCQWPMADGGICGSTHRLQLDHIVPVARGGESTVRNLRIACAMHNDVAARKVFGDAWMDRFTRGSSGLEPAARE